MDDPPLEGAVEYELRRGAYRNLTLRVKEPDGRLAVSAPWFVSKRAVDEFVASRAEWIARRRQALLQAVPAPGTWRVDGLGYRIEVTHPARRPAVVHREAERILEVRLAPGAAPEAAPEAALDRWEAARVAGALESLVPLWAARMGLQPSAWGVRKMRSRWGSCQPARGKLMFNSRLSAYPPQCLEYVVVHELAHLVEANHGPRFHALVLKHFPGAPEARLTLRGAGPSRDA